MFTKVSWWVVLLGFVLQFYNTLSAQEQLLPVYHFQHLTAADGSYPTVIRSAVVQDSSGFIWIGTANGLYRYDGYNFRIYRNDPDDPHSLSSNAVKSILVDSKRRMWLGTYETGLSLYDQRNDHFINFLPHEGDSSWYATRNIVVIMEDHSGNLWLGSELNKMVFVEIPEDSGMMELDSMARGIRFKSFSIGTPLNCTDDLLELKDNSILVASDSGLLVLDPMTKNFNRLHLTDPIGHKLDFVSITCLLRDSNGNFWLGTRNDGLFRIDWNTKIVQNYRHSGFDSLSLNWNDIQDIAEDKNRNLWVATRGSIDLFSPDSGHYLDYLTFGHSPKGSVFTNLSIDRSGTLWLGIGDNDVYRLSFESRRLPHYALRSIGKSPKIFQTIKRSPDGKYWISSGSTIYQVDIAAKKIIKVINVYQGKKPTAAIEDNSASFIDGHGNYWYGTYGLGLYKVNLSNGKVENYVYESNYYNNCLTLSIVLDSGDFIWTAGYYNGLLKFDQDSKTFQRVLKDSVSWAWNLMKDHEGKLWIATEFNGLFVYDPVYGTLNRYIHNAADPSSLSHDRTNKTYEDPSGRIWVSADNVLNLWNPVSRSFTRYYNPDFKDYSIAIPIGSDLKGRLWISCGNLLAILDPESGIFTNFSDADGLCGQIFAMENLPDGQIILTGFAGMNVINADSLVLHRSTPPLVLTRMAINDKPEIPPVHSKGLKLSFKQNVLEFEFAAIDIDAPQLVRYQYQLEGLEKEWVQPENRRYVRYPGLAPGNYVFKIMATSMRNEWPEQEIALAINIAPPWYRTTWAYMSYLFVFIGLLISSYQLRLKQLRLKHQVEMEHFQATRLAEVDRLKSRFFANISHEFRTPLTLITGPAEQAMVTTRESATKQRLRLIKDNAKKLLGLVNQLLDFSRLESGMMRLQVYSNDICHFLRRVVMSFESWAERKQITLEFHPDAESIQGYFDGDKLEKILNNLLSNALKFTPVGGKIEVTVSNAPMSPAYRPARFLMYKKGLEERSAEDIQISISDTGTGISKEHLPHIFDRFYRIDETHTTEGTGIGLALTNELVQLHHGKITVDSNPGQGSVFTVVLPIGKSAFAADEIVESPIVHQEPKHVDFGETEDEIRKVSVEKVFEIKPIVLVIEDNADLRRYIRDNLENYYAVNEAAGGKEGYDKAVEIVPDLVISDVMMPEMDGIELCRTLKKDIRTSHIPVILLTARAGTDSKIEGLDTGADDYVIKPFDMKELLARVRNLIEQRQQLRKKFSAGVLLKPGEVTISSLDESLLKRIMEVVEKKMGDEDFNVDELAYEVFLSKRHLERKLLALTNLSPAEFIRHMRLQRAYEMLEKKTGSVAEIAFQVGFSNPSYFSYCFHEHFGFPPSEIYRQSN
jgi:signal transduction histidine kinase/DNA-binding response OmpR family regulator/ligand-binding sensor domain-containing protein